MQGWIAQADHRVRDELIARAPTFAAILLPTQILLHAAGFWGAWLDLDALRWLTDLDQTTASAIGLLLAAASLLVATGIARRERARGHDGWWWGFAAFVLGPLGLAIWLTHHRTAHGAAPARNPAER